MDRQAMEKMLPEIGPQWIEGRYEPDCRDMDVAAIHQGFLRTARRAGAQLLCNAAVTAATRTAGKWLLDTRAGPVSADIVAIGAGAWADPVAEVGRASGRGRVCPVG